jgi:estrogen-related receptor beta like 1
MPPDICMDMLVDKLKVLEYEREWCRKKKPYKKPLNRLFFAQPVTSGNQNEQFFLFTSLVSLRNAGTCSKDGAIEGRASKVRCRLLGPSLTLLPAPLHSSMVLLLLQCSYLLAQAGVDFKEPKEFDDPNLTCNNLIGSLKKLGFASPR